MFQVHADLLEKSHRELETRLDNAQLSLAKKNEELARRIQEIETMKERLSGILETINDGVFLLDTSGTVALANRSAVEIFGDAPACSGFGNWPALQRLVDGDLPVRNVEIELSVDSETRIFLVSVIPMSQAGQTKPRKLISIKDVTDHRNLQERVAREDRMAALGQVAASVAHEIRNPLCGIEGFATLLVRDLKSMDVPSGLAEKIIYGVRQLNAVVSNLLNYTREMPADYSDHNLMLLIEDAASMVQPLAADHEVAFEIEQPATPVVAKVDPVQIRQVLTNIMLNAIQACPFNADGRVTVAVNDTSSSVTIVVRDNGRGIPSQVIGKIFDPFFTTKDGGIGLGLALSHRMIEGHGGKLTCSSRVGEYTEFSIKLNQSR